jgi:hypothetical protein
LAPPESQSWLTIPCSCAQLCVPHLSASILDRAPRLILLCFCSDWPAPTLVLSGCASCAVDAGSSCCCFDGPGGAHCLCVGTLGVSASSSFSSSSPSSRLVGDISLEQTYHRIPPPRLLERDVFARVGFTRARVLVALVFALAQRRVASFCPSMLADVAGALHAAERAARVSSSVS